MEIGHEIGGGGVVYLQYGYAIYIGGGCTCGEIEVAILCGCAALKDEVIVAVPIEIFIRTRVFDGVIMDVTIRAQCGNHLRASPCRRTSYKECEEQGE